MAATTFQTNPKADILIVDDTPANLCLLSRSLVKCNYKVSTVTSGRMALHAVNATPPDLILLDVCMPEMDGYDVCKELKANPQTATTPIIFLSGLDDAKHKVKAFEAGGVDYISKPFQKKEVIARIENQLTIINLYKQQIEQNKNLKEVNRRLEHEIYERKKVEMERDILFKKLHAENNSKDEFIATVSHELRTPLTTIRLTIEMLEKAKNEKNKQRYLKILREESEREIELVEELLSFQELEFSNIRATISDVYLQSLLPELIEPFKNRAKSNDQSLKVSCLESLPPILADIKLLKRVIVELLNNACKYTPEGGDICIEAHRNSFLLSPIPEKEELTLIVRNDCIGISKKNVNKIFEKFYRVPGTDIHNSGGTGLGLAIVKKSVELMNASIQVVFSQERISFVITFLVSARKLDCVKTI